MKAKQKTLLVLLALLLAAAAALGAVTALGAAASESAADTGVAVTSFSADEATSISYTYNGETHELVKQGNTWVLADDPAYQVDQTVVNSMLSALCSLSATRELTDVTDYAQYGLASPSLTVTAQIADSTVTLYYGDSNTVTGDVYLQREGSESVYTVAASKQSCFQYDKAALYDTSYSPVTLQRDSITAIQYHFQDSQESFTVSLEATSVAVAGDSDSTADSETADSDSADSDSAVTYETQWFLAGDGDTLDQDLIDAMLEAATAATSAQDTAPASLADYGLDDPILTVQLTDSAGVSQTLALGIGTQGYYMQVQGSDSVFTVDVSTLNAFAYTADELKQTAPEVADSTADTSTDSAAAS